MASRVVPLVQLVGALVLGVVAASAVGLSGSAGRSARDRPEATPPPAPAPTPSEVAPRHPAPLPVAQPPQGFRMRDGGSYFRARVRSGAGPIVAFEGLLLSDRPSECLDGCPLGLRTVHPPAAEERRAALLASLDPYLDDLETASASVPTLAATLRAVRAGQARAPDPSGRRPRRVLSLGIPRPEFGSHVAEVVLALYDHCDPHFDAARGIACEPGGAHLVIVRLERHDVERSARDTIAGLVELESKPRSDDAPFATVGAGAEPVVRTIGPVNGHFAGVRGEVLGLYLDPEGVLFVYDETLVPLPIEPDPALVAAVRALVGRA